MRKVIINIVSYQLLIMIVMVATSCHKLEVVPQSTITTANYGTSAVQIEAEFAGSMDMLWGKYYGYGIAGSGTVEFIFTNDDQMRGGNLMVAPNAADNMWKWHYQALVNVNNALGSIKKGMVKEKILKTKNKHGSLV